MELRLQNKEQAKSNLEAPNTHSTHREMALGAVICSIYMGEKVAQVKL